LAPEAVDFRVGGITCEGPDNLPIPRKACPIAQLLFELSQLLLQMSDTSFELLYLSGHFSLAIKPEALLPKNISALLASISTQFGWHPHSLTSKNRIFTEAAPIAKGGIVIFATTGLPANCRICKFCRLRGTPAISAKNLRFCYLIVRQAVIANGPELRASWPRLAPKLH